MNLAPSCQHDETLELILFTADQYCFGVESLQVRGSGPLPEDTIPDVESLLSLTASEPGTRRQCLTIKGSSQDYGLSVAVPLELYKLAVERIHPLPAAVSASCRLPGLRGLAMTDAGLILLIDLRSLLTTT